MKHGFLFKNARISKIIRYMHEKKERSVNLSKLTSVVCISADNFIQFFKEGMNCTPLKYVNVKKIEKAQLLLIITNMLINNITLELSVNNISYFNRMFKQYTNRIPVQYRKYTCNSI